MEHFNDIKRIRDAFEFAANLNNNNSFTTAISSSKTININGYRIAIMALFGFEPYEWDIENTFHQLNIPTDRIDINEFQSIVERKISTYYDRERQIRETFTAFDSDWKGYITLEDVKNIWKKVLPNVSWNAIRDAFYEACCFDENDQMSYLQFRHFLFNL